MLNSPKARASFVLYTLNNAITLIAGLIVTPLMVKSLGSVVYGQFIVINQAISYLSLFDIGNASFLKYELARSSQSDDHRKKNRLITAALLTQFLTLPVQITILAASIKYLESTSLNTENKHEGIGLLIILLALAYIVGRITAPFSYILFGCNRDHITAGKRIIEQVIQLFLDIITLSIGMSARWLAANRITTNVIGAASMIISAKTTAKWFKVEWPRKTELAETIRANGRYLVLQWGTIFSECVDITMVGIFFGPKIASAFSLTMSLPRILLLSLSSIFTVAIPTASKNHSTGDNENFSRIYNQSQQIGIVGLGIVGAPIAALNQNFVYLWVGENQFAGQELTILGIFFFVSIALTRMNLGMIMAAGMFKSASSCQVISSAIGLLATYILKPLIQLNAIPIGLIVGRIVAIQMIKRKLISKGHSLNSEIRLLTVFVLTTLLAGFVGKNIGNVDGWAQLLLIASTISFGSAILIIIAGFDNNTRAMIIQGMMKKILKPSRK